MFKKKIFAYAPKNFPKSPFLGQVRTEKFYKLITIFCALTCKNSVKNGIYFPWEGGWLLLSDPLLCSSQLLNSNVPTSSSYLNMHLF